MAGGTSHSLKGSALGDGTDWMIKLNFILSPAFVYILRRICCNRWNFFHLAEKVQREVSFSFRTGTFSKKTANPQAIATARFEGLYNVDVCIYCGKYSHAIRFLSAAPIKEWGPQGFLRKLYIKILRRQEHNRHSLCKITPKQPHTTFPRTKKHGRSVARRGFFH